MSIQLDMWDFIQEQADAKVCNDLVFCYVAHFIERDKTKAEIAKKRFEKNQGYWGKWY